MTDSAKKICVEGTVATVSAFSAIGLACLITLANTQAVLAAPPGDLPFGVYDPLGQFTDDSEVTIEHIFLPWEDVSLDTLVVADNYALERNRALLITIEPWTWTRDERNTAEFLLRGIQDGYYDANMRAICQVIDTLQSPISIRWAHEMEHDWSNFIWANWSPADYISSYQRMIGICRESAPRVNVIWSPRGEPDLESYYPGDGYVDIVGISIFGYQAFEVETFGRPRSYNESLIEAYNYASVFGKPVVVAEVGYTGDSEYVNLWESQVRNPPENLDLLVGAIYFNQNEVYNWPNGERPNWTISDRITE